MKPISRSPSYLVHTQYGYCFRMKVPSDLQRFVGRKELRYTLKTGYVGTAKGKARFLAAQFQQLFRYLRKGGAALSKLTEDQVKSLVEQYIKDSLESLMRENHCCNIPVIFTIVLLSWKLSEKIWLST